MAKNREEYFASKEAEDTARIVRQKANRWFHNLDVNGYLDKLKEAWSAYHGAYYTDAGSGHRITFSGEQGELVNLPVNHYRNICRHMLTMVTSNRPAMQARATNTDYKSLVQTKLANGLLDYYMREKRLEDYLVNAIEHAIVFGSGYVKMEWNATSGEIHDYIESEYEPEFEMDDETGEESESFDEEGNPNYKMNEEGEPVEKKAGFPVYEGDVEFSSVSPFDVVFDSTKEDNKKHEWVLIRSFKNRFDLAAKYPEQEEEILTQETKDQKERYNFNSAFYDETDDISVYEFYHKRTESMPDGRYLLFVDSDIVLMDAPMPYRDLPVFRVVPGDILGTPYGYTDTFDLLPIQDALNSLYSAVLTNHNAFAVQNVLMPRGSDINPTSIPGALNILEYNHQVGKPEALNLTATPPEVFQFMNILEKTMETVSGVNSVSRGNPESSLKSGNALALVQSMSLQFISGLQHSYVKLIEDVGTGLVNMLKDFASAPRIAMITGESNRTYMKEFTGDDLSNINRVIVDVGNPLSKCLEKDTPILMHDGRIQKVQDIEIGDKLMGPDSQPRTVTNTNTGTEMMYKIRSKDKHRKVEYGCNESHILTLRYCSDDVRYDAKKGDILDISVKDYLNLSGRQQRLLQGFKTDTIHFQPSEKSIPAYILGLWLGDGTSETTALTSMDTELIESWSNYAMSINMNIRVQEISESNQSKTYFITSGQSHGKPNRNPMLTELKLMEVIKNKHIPHCYKASSESDRLELLAGIIDTDGYNNDGTFIITQKNTRLSEDIEFLSSSLGFKTNLSKIIVDEKEYNKITIGGDTWRIPTKLPRKQVTEKEKSRNWLNYGIDVVPVGEGEYFGFTLKEDPHFVLGDFTVTHNTTAGRVQMAEQMLQMNLIDRPEQYISVINTGKLETMTDGIDRQLMLIRAENEKLVAGESIISIDIEPHSLHIKEHRDVLADPDLKNDPDLVARVLEHIQSHIDALRSADPDLLMHIGEQPLAPPGGMPATQPGPDGMVNQSGIGQAGETLEQQPQAPDIGLPQPASPPAPFENMPTDAKDTLPE